MDHITTFAKKAFYVDAVQVDATNMYEVAVWCKGELLDYTWNNRHLPHNDKDPDRHDKYVKVNVIMPSHGRANPRNGMAFVGDWVVKSTTGWKVYGDKAFKNTFEPLIEEPCGRTDLTVDHKPCVLGRGHAYAPDIIACRSLRDYKAGHK